MTPAERLRKHQRALEKTQRELDRERTKLENQEKKLVQEIKKNAKNGQMGAVKVQAKDLVRTRRYIQKFYQMRTQLQAISLRIQTVRSNEQMMQSMKGATKLLGSMNKQMNLPALQRIAMEFEKENDIMDQRQEMMDDAIDEMLASIRAAANRDLWTPAERAQYERELADIMARVRSEAISRA